MSNPDDLATAVLRVAAMVKVIAEETDDVAVRAIVYDFRQTLIKIADTMAGLVEAYSISLGVLDLLARKSFIHYESPDGGISQHGSIAGVHCTTVTMVKEILRSARDNNLPITGVREP